MGEYIIRGISIQTASQALYKAGVDANQLAKSDLSVTRDKPLYNTKLGTPVFSDLEVQPFNYTIDGVTYFVPGVKMFDMLIYTSGQKSIIKTPIQGLNGTVKEYISSGDDAVVIEGRIAGDNGIYPVNAVADLKKLINAPVAFKVISRYLQVLDIDTLVIEDYEIPQEKGGYSYQNFKLYCITDLPVELNIVSSSNTTAQ